jgi:hypothetical protein
MVLMLAELEVFGRIWELRELSLVQKVVVLWKLSGELTVLEDK